MYDLSYVTSVFTISCLSTDVNIPVKFLAEIFGNKLIWATTVNNEQKAWLNLQNYSGFLIVRITFASEHKLACISGYIILDKENLFQRKEKL